MLIDSTHKRWGIGTTIIAVLALVLYFWLRSTWPGELTGGSSIGLWYGVAGALLMIYAGLLAAHRRLLRWPAIPSRTWWLRGHIWLGLLSFVFVLCHSGFGLGGALEKILWAIFVLTLVTGIFGLGLQQFLPRVLAAIPQETPYEQIPHVCAVLRERADRLVDDICGTSHAAGDPRLQESDRLRLRKLYDQSVRPFLGPNALPGKSRRPAGSVFSQAYVTPGLLPVKEQLQELESFCEERQRLFDQARLHGWLHGWLLLHVPLSLALLVIGLAHVIGSLYY